MNERLIIVGGGDHARVIGETARACASFSLIGFVAPEPQPLMEALLDLPWLGNDDALHLHGGAKLALGIGAVGRPRVRRAVESKLSAAGWQWATIVHPSAVVSPSVQLGSGTVVLPRVVLHTSARIGAFSLINTGAILEHDVDVADHSIVGPGALLAGGVTVGRGAFIGLGAVIRDHVNVGQGAVVAMGAVVIRDVPDGQTVAGIPARALRMSTQLP